MADRIDARFSTAATVTRPSNFTSSHVLQHATASLTPTQNQDPLFMFADGLFSRGTIAHIHGRGRPPFRSLPLDPRMKSFRECQSMLSKTSPKIEKCWCSLNLLIFAIIIIQNESFELISRREKRIYFN